VRDNLPADVRAELEDEEYATRKHYSRATYALGCHGPLCRKKERDRGRDRNEVRAKNAGRKYRPNQEVRLDNPTLDEIVDWYIEWYEEKVDVAS
jgi:hypothetical protein